MAETPSNEPREDAVAKAGLLTVGSTTLPAEASGGAVAEANLQVISVETFATDAYQILSQLSPQDLEQLANRLKELLSQKQPPTIGGNAQLDPVTAAGTLTTEVLPQPQAKKLWELFTKAANTLSVAKTIKIL